MVGLRPYFSMSTRCVAPLRGDWAIGRMWSARENSLKHSAITGNWNRATKRTACEIHLRILSITTDLSELSCPTTTVYRQLNRHWRRLVYWHTCYCTERRAKSNTTFFLLFYKGTWPWYLPALMKLGGYEQGISGLFKLIGWTLYDHVKNPKYNTAEPNAPAIGRCQN